VKTLTYDDYLRLTGLLVLAADHRRMLESIEQSALSITGEEKDGHTSDCIWGQDYSPEHLLELLSIPLPTPSTPHQAAGAMSIVKQFDDFKEE